jgi:hypothetical protein
LSSKSVTWAGTIISNFLQRRYIQWTTH